MRHMVGSMVKPVVEIVNLRRTFNLEVRLLLCNVVTVLNTSEPMMRMRICHGRKQAFCIASSLQVRLGLAA